MIFNFSRKRKSYKRFLSLVITSGMIFYGYPVFGEEGDDARGEIKDKYKKSKLTSDRSQMNSDKREILLTLGEDRIVDLDFDANVAANAISVGDPRIVKHTLVKIEDKRQIVFKALKAGETNITLRDQTGNVRLIFHVEVAAGHLDRLTKELKYLLRDIEGVNANIVGRKIVVDGEVLTPNDYGRLITVINDPAYNKLVLNLVILSPLTMQFLAQKIEKDVKAFAPEVTTRVVNKQIWLEGQAANRAKANRAFRIANLYLPEFRPPEQIIAIDPRGRGIVNLIQNLITIKPPPPRDREKLIRVTLHFVELSKNYSRIFGFKWQPGFSQDAEITIGTDAGGGTGASDGIASLTAIIGNLFPKLQSAQTAGYAKILKQGTVIVKSGQVARLEDRTFIPFGVSSGGGQVQTATAGVGMVFSVTPVVVGQSEDISLDVNLSQTNLTGRSGSRPITSTHQIQTKLFVKNEESAAMAAVNNTDVTTNFNQDDPASGGFADPGTQPLFSLLRSKSYNKTKSQFVVFITPVILKSASEGTEDLKKNFRVRIN